MDGDGDHRSQASSRRSHGTHRSRRSQATTTATTRNGTKASRPPLTESNLRTLTEVSATTPSQVPRAYNYRSPYAETAPRDLALSRPTLLRAPTAPPTVNRTASDPSLASTMASNNININNKKKKEIDMNLAYGNIPPDLASRTDLGPVTPAEEESAEAQREREARQLLGRIDTLLDEAECVQHTATNIIEQLQRKPEAAAAVALLLAELSTLLKTMSPGFLGVVKGGFPAIFALLASPQFLIGVGVAVGVTVIFFGGWKIVKSMRAAKIAAAEKEKEMMGAQAQAQAQAFEMQDQVPPPSAEREAFMMAGAGAYGPPGPGSYDDALVLDEELSTIETWRRGIVPDGEDEDLESVDLELITPEAVRSVRGDAMSIRTGRTHRSAKSHRSHRSRRHEEVEEVGDVPVPVRTSSRAHSKAGDAAESEAGSERSRRTAKSKTTVRTELKAIEDGSRQKENTLDAVLRPKEKKSSMLKTLFKKKKDKEESRESAVSVMA